MAKARTDSRAPRRAGTRSQTELAENGTPDWTKVAQKLTPYAEWYERWHIKAITNEEYAKARGCFSPCDLGHYDHFPPTDGFPALLVTFKGDWGVTHRRHDGSREMPSYIFSPGAGVIRVTDPFDKLSYVNRHLTNPEVWDVAFESPKGGKA